MPFQSKSKFLLSAMVSFCSARVNLRFRVLGFKVKGLGKLSIHAV